MEDAYCAGVGDSGQFCCPYSNFSFFFFSLVQVINFAWIDLFIPYSIDWLALQRIMNIEWLLYSFKTENSLFWYICLNHISVVNSSLFVLFVLYFFGFYFLFTHSTSSYWLCKYASKLHCNSCVAFLIVQRLHWKLIYILAFFYQFETHKCIEKELKLLSGPIFGFASLRHIFILRYQRFLNLSFNFI